MFGGFSLVHVSSGKFNDLTIQMLNIKCVRISLIVSCNTCKPCSEILFYGLSCFFHITA